MSVNFRRTTISIPGWLKAKMVGYEKRHKHLRINWSDIAAQAFADEIGETMPVSLEGRVARIEKHLGLSATEKH